MTVEEARRLLANDAPERQGAGPGDQPARLVVANPDDLGRPLIGAAAGQSPDFLEDSAGFLMGFLVGGVVNRGCGNRQEFSQNGSIATGVPPPDPEEEDYFRRACSPPVWHRGQCAFALRPRGSSHASDAFPS